MGLRVGRDVGVIGFDDSVEARHINPPLTSVAQNRYLIGKRAADLFMRCIKYPDEAPSRLVLPTHLVIRKSCGEQ
jgi:DNA-binding LacI/PurR family transcriptional regulator